MSPQCSEVECLHHSHTDPMSFFSVGAVEKSRQRRSRHFSVLTYWKYALRAKMTKALLDEPFGKTQGMLF